MRIPELDHHHISYRLTGVSALEWFFRRSVPPVTMIESATDVVQLAPVVDELEFPGFPDWDASFRSRVGRVLVRGIDAEPAGGPASLDSFSFDPIRRAFADPHGWYESLAEARARLGKRRSHSSPDPAEVEPLPVPMDDLITAAVVAARFPLVPEGWPQQLPELSLTPAAPGAWHRAILELILTGPFAWRGLDMLFRSGYVAEVLPELLPMNRTDHSKEGHPEGNVWWHSLETLKYRKQAEFAISLALLLHDAGKPYAEPEGNRRFNRHAEIGADLARRIMERLELSPGEREEVAWLIRHHMIPGAIDRLPDHRRDPVMASPHFPALLEVYRCDLSSTFRGPDNYYRACRVYRGYLKRARRAARSAPPRRLVELYVE